MDYSIDNIREVDKGYLRASFDLIVGPFIIKDFLLFEKDGENWVSSPSRKYEDSDGATKYFNYVRCADEEKWKSFSNWAIDLVVDKIGSHKEPAPTPPEDNDIPF